MYIGIFKLKYHLEMISSLKEKRTISRRVIERVKSHFNVAIGEVGCNDSKDLLEIGGTFVGNDRGHIDSIMNRLLAFIEEINPGYLMERRTEITPF